MIHKVLKYVACISKSKGHQQELVHPKGGDDGSLLDVLRSNRYLVLSLLEVKFREHSRTVNPQGEMGNVWGEDKDLEQYPDV